MMNTRLRLAFVTTFSTLGLGLSHGQEAATTEPLAVPPPEVAPAEAAPVAEAPAEPVSEVQAPEPAPEPASQGDLVIADFEGSDYGAWTVTGEAFGAAPAKGAIDGQMDVSGFEGQGLANSFNGGDQSTGQLVSPDFIIERPYVNFLVGGGNHPGATTVRLVVEGQVVAETPGPESETLAWRSWSVGAHQGKTAHIEIIDTFTEGWGHIMADQFTQSETFKVAPLVDGERTLAINARYLNLPIKTGAPKVRVKLIIGGKLTHEFDAELSAEPDFWAFTDLLGYENQPLSIQVSGLPEDSAALDTITLEGTIKNEEELYQEPLRPQIHFSTRRGWINDPNGLVHYAGEYHLFYQHNPYGWNWGNMHWGHAISEDMLHWKEQPIAIYPKAYGDWAFSGSAVVDSDNTSGFKTEDNKGDVLVGFYTSTGRGECVVFSNDAGRSWTEYEGNPVVKHKGRDPKVIWHAGSKRWSMAVYDEADDKRAIAFYSSSDLKAWNRESTIEGFFECPEIFQLPVDLNPTERRWVLYAADGRYRLGAFDGKTFTPETEMLDGNYGNCFYASQTWSDIPNHDGRRIQLAWGRIAMPGMPFNQMMLFPSALRLKTTDEGIRMFTYPIREVARLHQDTIEQNDQSIPAGGQAISGASGDLFDIQATFVGNGASAYGFDVRGVRVLYHPQEGSLTCGDKTAPLKAAANGEVKLRLLVDRTSIEIYANEGVVYMPLGVEYNGQGVSLVSEGAPTMLKSLRLSTLKSIWK